MGLDIDEQAVWIEEDRPIDQQIISARHQLSELIDLDKKGNTILKRLYFMITEHVTFRLICEGFPEENFDKYAISHKYIWELLLKGYLARQCSLIRGFVEDGKQDITFHLILQKARKLNLIDEGTKKQFFKKLEHLRKSSIKGVLTFANKLILHPAREDNIAMAKMECNIPETLSELIVELEDAHIKILEFFREVYYKTHNASFYPFTLEPIMALLIQSFSKQLLPNQSNKKFEDLLASLQLKYGKASL